MNLLRQQWVWLLLCALSLGQLSKLFLSSKTDQPKDFRQLYLSSILMSQNQQPYNDSLIKALWANKSESEGFRSNTLPGAPYNRSVYPPHTLRFIQPLSALPWSTARLIWWAVVVLAFAGTVFFMPYIKWWQALLVLLSFKVGVSSLILGQPVWVFSFSLILFLHSQMNGSKLLAVVAFLGMSLKISLLLPVLLWLLLRRKWSVLALATLSGTLILGSLIVLEGRHISVLIMPWIEQMSLQWKSAYDGTAANPIIFNLTELGVMFSRLGIWQHPTFNYVLFGLGLIGLVIYQMRFNIQEFSVLLLLFLLQFICGYHLIYDLIVLVPVFAYTRIRFSPLMLLLAAPLLLPFNALFPAVSLLKLHLPVFLVCLIGVFLVSFARKLHGNEPG